ncbi:hypothetical protein [Lactobacillus mulieris]|uniref:Uncharacterized protein n=1 Tax=Lactobacillus mulieris TaxID=2508708 RepID=A0AAW5WZK2_9LACO|nr:hypothetical protein [Lactobacillus mulieris]MCZ3622444.1 hypothetical protein [Lactobacillus mulieris]MCZ3624136.1 hypothetical protein [Lactobacillus mulieris]MCZ3636451.1 hypothetical protein [Lactobacillus mulieris]MCZ3690249.1 hypothetical protein [Lactobacillus mulieris]MCZ3696089.1 hypothetical protein [Lactobacillus mulieris]
MRTAELRMKEETAVAWKLGYEEGFIEGFIEGRFQLRNALLKLAKEYHKNTTEFPLVDLNINEQELFIDIKDRFKSNFIRSDSEIMNLIKQNILKYSQK